MSEVSFNPLYNFFPLPTADPSLNDAMRQIDDSLRFLYENSSASPGGVVTQLGDLADVDLAGLQDQDFLQYDAGSGEWIRTAIVPGGSLGSLSDVTITAPRNLQALKYNGAQWVNVGPVNLAFSYNPNGSLAGVDGSNVNVDFSYNADGSVQSIDNQVDTLAFAYNPDGSLDSITVTPS